MEETHKVVEAAHIAAQVAKTAAEEACRVAQRAELTAQKVVGRTEETTSRILLFSQTMEYIKSDIAEIKRKLDDKYVTKEEFETVKMIVYGLVSLILIGFVGALISLIYIR